MIKDHGELVPFSRDGAKGRGLRMEPRLLLTRHGPPLSFSPLHTMVEHLVHRGEAITTRTNL